MVKKKLTGVNRLLKTIGEPPLQNEDDFQLSDEAILAESQINETTETILSKGFKFNTVDAFTLSPDINGYIHIPPDSIVVEINDDKLTIKEGLLFDRTTQSMFFTNSIDVKIIFNSDFDYIPKVIQEAILAEASYIFQRDNINDPNVNRELDEARKIANRDLNIYYINQAKATGLNDRFSRNSNPTGTQ